MSSACRRYGSSPTRSATSDKEAILQYGAGHDFEIVAAIPWDADVAEADRLGLSAIDHAPDAAAVRAIGALADVLAERLGASVPVG